MQNKLNIPYYSQFSDVKDKYWQSRACGALCLKSILNFYEKENLNSDEFIKLAESKKAYGENGWIHQGLVNVAKGFGIDLVRKEFKSESPENQKKILKEGIEEIKKSLQENKPVLVSVVKKFSEKDKFHMVVLTGFESENELLTGFYYNDTDYRNDEGKDLFVDIETFKTYWRKLAIFVG